MATTQRGETIHQELERMLTALRDDREQPHDNQTSPTPALRRLLAEKRGVFKLLFESYLGIFSLICQVNQEWRLTVFRGEEPYTPEMDAVLKTLFESWQRLSDAVRQQAEFYDRHGPPLDPGLYTNLRLYGQEVSRILREWRPPSLSTAKALRLRRVSREEATQLGFAVE